MTLTTTADDAFFQEVFSKMQQVDTDILEQAAVDPAPLLAPHGLTLSPLASCCGMGQ